MIKSTTIKKAYTGDKPFCDVVMKGGVASGVVYPLAITELAKTYKLQSIGGTSAGAMAAAIAAAAEYNRAGGGYERIAEIPHQLGPNLLNLFQPSARMAPVFKVLLTATEKQPLVIHLYKILLIFIRHYTFALSLGLLPAFIFLMLGLFLNNTNWLVVAGFMVFIGPVVTSGLFFAQTILKGYPEHDYGLCSGLTMPNADHPGLTDWMVDQIDYVAGLRQANNQSSSRTLTIGDLRNPENGTHAIEFASITTDISSGRPYQLPFKEPGHYFSKSDFEKIFPKRIVDAITPIENKVQGPDNVTGDLYHFPEANDLPVAVATRMSMSFPGLIQSVPLYRKDMSYPDPQMQYPRRCLFSDGGITSNFPIHFFDHLWPNKPTFGISMEDYTSPRHGNKRVFMAVANRDGSHLPIKHINSVSDFFHAMTGASANWPDTLQSELPGYRERIVHIALDPKSEGGLNLDMSEAKIQELIAYGQKAGQVASEEFHLDAHRWRRFLVAMKQLEDALDQMVDDFDSPPQSGISFNAFLKQYDSTQPPYEEIDPEWRAEAQKRAEELVTLGRKWRTGRRISDGNIPRPNSVLRLTPEQ